MSGSAYAASVDAEFRLDNGLCVVCQRDASIPFVAFRLCVRAGAAQDGRLPGLAHVCEHLACEGATRAGRSWGEDLYRAGGTNNGWTWHDYTAFADFLPTAVAARGLAITAERLQPADNWITDEDVGREANTIVREYQDRSAMVAFSSELEQLQRLLYPSGHPYHWPAGGTADTLQQIVRDDTVAFFKQWYTPDRALLTVVGDIDPDRLCREVEDHLAHLRSGSPRQEPPRAAHSKPGDAYYEIVGPNVRYTCAYVAYRLPGYAHPGWLEGSLFARAIALGRSSPLRRELARQKIAHDIRVYIEPREDATTVAFVARAVPGVSTTELERVFVTTLERAIGGEVRVADVERARKSELIALQMNADKLVVRTEHLARATMLRRWYSTPNDLDLLQQGLPSSILADGRHMFAANDRVRLVVASSPSNS